MTLFVKNEKSGIIAIAVLNRFLFLLLSIFPSFLFADRFSVQGSVSSLFDSNIEHLSIVDFLTMGKRYGIFIHNDAAFDYSFGDNDAFSTGLSLAADTGLNVPEKSHLNTFAEFGWHGVLRDDVSLDLALMAHHAAENFLRMRNMFLDLFVTADLFWDINAENAAYGTFKTGYFTGFDEEMRYMTGPSFGIETGYFHYPTEATDYLKLGAGLEGYFFRPEILTSCTDTLSITNSFLKPYIFFEGKYDAAPVFLKATLRYAYMEWLKSDHFNDWSKRRKEHIPSVTAQVLWEISAYLSLSLTYSYRYFFSNFGRDPGDYVNYTMDRHTVTLDLTARYEGETR